MTFSLYFNVFLFLVLGVIETIQFICTYTKLRKYYPSILDTRLEQAQTIILIIAAVNLVIYFIINLVMLFI